jgi:hypothetical protein
MIRRIAPIFIILVSLSAGAIAQGLGDGLGDLPVNTQTKEYRLLGVPTDSGNTGTSLSPVPSATAVPEPNAWALLLLGGAALAAASLGRRGFAKRRGSRI